MRNVYALILLISMASFGFSQSVQEERKVQESDDHYQIYLKYAISDSEQANAAADITKILGNGMDDKNWVSEKSKDSFVIVKMINGYVFVRGFDVTSEKKLRSKLVALDKALEKYSDN